MGIKAVPAGDVFPARTAFAMNQHLKEAIR